MIDTYIQNTSDYYKIKILDMFEIEREGEKKSFNPLKLKNKKLLFHGSRFSNFPGILSNGLRIAPPEAPCSGYAFGKGVYLADFAGKSAPYSCPHLSKNEVLLIMCEAALGNPRELTNCDSNGANNLPKDKHSTHALGVKRPDPSGSIQFEKDIEVPLGKK
jgi:poly [ADP-ribose] polymerase